MAYAKITIKCSEIGAFPGLDWEAVGELALSYNKSCKDTFDIAALLERAYRPDNMKIGGNG